MVLQQLAPEAILSVQLLIPQLYNYRIIVQLSEVTLIDFCIAQIIAVRLGLIFHGTRTGEYYCKNMKYRINKTYYTGQRGIMTRYFTSCDSIVTSRRRVEIQSKSEMSPYFTMTKCNKLFITYLTRSTER